MNLSQEEIERIGKAAADAALREHQEFSVSKMLRFGFGNGKGLSNILRIVIALGLVVLALSLTRGVKVLGNLPLLERQVQENTESIEDLDVKTGAISKAVISINQELIRLKAGRDK